MIIVRNRSEEKGENFELEAETVSVHNGTCTGSHSEELENRSLK